VSYWEEVVSIALEDAGIKATQAQIESIAGAVEVSHDNYGMAHGHDCIPNPATTELDSIKKKLAEERSKVACKECGGTGFYVHHFLNRTSSGQCGKCRGEGKHLP
jgi:hypothetical protein